MSAVFFEMVMKGRVARPVEHLDDDTLMGNQNKVIYQSEKGL
jgi:hypothetical protein